MKLILLLLSITLLSGCATTLDDPKSPCSCYNPQPINEAIHA